MTYKTREGVVLVKVADQPLLIASRIIWGKCPQLKRLPKGSDIYWTLLSKGIDENNIIQLISLLTHKPQELIKEYFDIFLDQLIKEGYLIKVENQNSAS